MALREAIIAKVMEAGGRLTVRSALNPILWLCAIVSIPCATIYGLIQSRPVWLAVLAFLPVSAAIFGFLFLLFFDRDKRKAYLLAYSNTLGTREEVKKCVDSIREIIDWRYDLPHTFYLISEASASTLSDLITNRMGKKGIFIIVELESNYSGWLPKESWHLLQKKVRLPE